MAGYQTGNVVDYIAATTPAKTTTTATQDLTQTEIPGSSKLCRALYNVEHMLNFSILIIKMLKVSIHIIDTFIAVPALRSSLRCDTAQIATWNTSTEDGRHQLVSRKTSGVDCKK
ncbi:hypothetical protein HELRODRAFT_161312 [Helobdella robusta]|uniref:Uncharacterized protein n=1 Tax=Helobdella robusta TaxID=6412 RepID=T1ERB7_HELRO|nr:hypothetical protein HELRODRAFT_161312 [Helobdella robusta]ESO02083.1 hypothetical protein HELRODRAFT_161312 [Helobdella robusta]